LLDGLRGKLSGANDALAGAHKAWRDDRLEGREAAVAQREAELTAREEAVRALQESVRKAEARWFRQKIGFGLGALVAAVPSLAGGIALGALVQGEPTRSLKREVRLTPAVSPASTPPPGRAPSPQPEAQATPVERVRSGEPTSTSEALDFDECVRRIEVLSDQFDMAPINIVDTSILRIARFVMSDGSVLISCSRADQKMVVTRSPYS
jgi:hypothetical protein